jgi:FtsH-binding integral membrane protein
MQHELLLRAITHSTIGIVLIMLLLVLLIGLRRELQGGEPIRWMVHLGILVMGLCTFLALMAALYSAKALAVPQRMSQKLDTAWMRNGVCGDAQ